MIWVETFLNGVTIRHPIGHYIGFIVEVRLALEHYISSWQELLRIGRAI